MTWFEQNSRVCHYNNNALVVERNVPWYYASGPGFDSDLCSFRFGGIGYASYFSWDRFNSSVFVFTP